MGFQEKFDVGRAFDVDAWLRRIGHTGSARADLPTLRGVIAAHTATIPFENIDVLSGPDASAGPRDRCRTN